MEYCVEIENLTKKYGNFYALKGINLKLFSGKIIGLLGVNGSGKTTLLKILAGLLTPTDGKVLIDGKTVGVESKKIVSFLPDKSYLRNYMTVKNCLDFFEDFYEDFDRAKAEGFLQSLHLDVNKKYGELSKGTKEKLQLTLVMSRNAQLYLLDEPIGGVDPAAREFILSTILKRNPNSTVIISTHLIADVEGILDEFLFTYGGKVVRYDSIESVKKEGKTLDATFREEFKYVL